jgi:hypothetical protein
MVGEALMPYQMKPLACDPARIKNMSEPLIVSHYENNYGGAVKRLNLIEEQLAKLDYAKAAGFLVNGLKREQLIAMNSMILHELFFDGLGEQSEPAPQLRDALARDFGSYERWRAEFIAMGKALGGRRSSRRRPHAGDGRSRTGRTPRWYVACLIALAAVSFAMDRPLAQAPEPLLLQLEGKIPLGDVSGRIDHMAIDLPRRRLFVAELGNDSVAVVDINERRVQHVITGLKQPQGLGYVPSNDTLFVANAGDGSVRLFRGADYAESGSIDLGEDADNIRVDAASNRVFVGYGSGGLAEIDPATNGKVLDLPLPAHPEGFQLARSVRRIFVNLPKARMIAVIDRFAGKQVASWPVDNESFFPMALDEQSGRILVAFRNPARLGVFSMQDGSNIATFDACGDSDDLFVDAKRHRIYQSCGDGHLDVFEVDGDAYRRSAHIQTIAGGRTALFVPEIDRLFVAARANPGEPAAIWIFRPTP